MKTIYHYHPVTHEFTGSSEARESPLEPGVYLIPALATDTPPPAIQANEVAVLSGGTWTVLPDFRGTYYGPDRKPVQITEIGVPLPPNLTVEPVPFSPAELFEQQKVADEAEVRRVYEEESEAPVECLGHTWNGGQDSASYIQGAVGLAQALGENTVTITDINNVAHVLSFTDALTVAAYVGVQFRTAFFKKQAALVEIAGRTLGD